MSDSKLYRKSEVRPAKGRRAAAQARMPSEERELGLRLLCEAEHHWAAMDRFRRDRERNKKYTYGDQWSDMVEADGRLMTEEQYIKEQGNVPLTSNLLRRLVRNVLGVYRSQSTEPTCMARDRQEQPLAETMTTLMQYNRNINSHKEINARTMEEFLISGLAVQKKWFGWRNGRMDCWTDIVQPNNFFIDSNMRDCRGWDCRIVGEVHDVPFGELASQFAHSPQEHLRLQELYAEASTSWTLARAWEDFGYSRGPESSFAVPSRTGLCRVFEIWRKETVPRLRCHDTNSGEMFKIDLADRGELVQSENASRISRGQSAGMELDEIPLIETEWMLDESWRYYFVTPAGAILAQGDTPYLHGSHPYVFKAYPFVDGEIHSFVSDVIDQQRYTNRLVTLYDWVMRASAKGVLLFPEECIPEGMSLEDVADEWSRFNGVIAIKAKPGVPLPQQISNNATNVGIGELLNVQLRFFEDISGVHGALQGKTATSGVSGTLYSQQANNATKSLLDMLDSFAAFEQQAAYVDLKNMQQSYDTRKIREIAGSDALDQPLTAQKIRDAEFDISIAESTTTPAYRAIANDFLVEVWRSGQITLEQLLEVGSFPYGDKLLQSIQASAQAMADAQAMANGETPTMPGMEAQ